MIRDSRFWLSVSSVLVLGTLVIAGILEGGQEWEEYQVRYRKLAVDRAQDSRVRQAAEGMEIKLQQSYLPRLHRVDRCISCHLGVENPQMASAPQPFRLHPGDHLQRHRVDRFGCTVCHQGQGRATNAREAHGHIAHWEEPMLRGDLLEASCGRCHAGDVIEGAPVITRGRQLIGEYGCRGCHVIQGLGASVGPELTGVATKDVNGDHKVDAKDWEWHFKHFADPRAMVEGSVMPRLDVGYEDIRALTVAMLALTDEDIHQEYRPVEPPVQIRRLFSATERGKIAWARYGCAGCHGRDGSGGIENPNSWGGHIPSLSTYAAGLARDQETVARIQQLIEDSYRKAEPLGHKDEPWLKKVHGMRKAIVEGVPSVRKDPSVDLTPLDMPAWGNIISDEEINDLIAYVLSFFPPATVQPVAFNHKSHGDKGLACQDCHSGVRSGLQATLPSVEVCGECHTEDNQELADSPEARKVARFVKDGKEIPWNRLTGLPDHVMFSHRVHVVAGEVGCEECHGDMGQRTTPPPYHPVHIEMAACLDCHRRVGAREECEACHR